MTQQTLLKNKPKMFVTCKQTNKEKIALETYVFLSHHHQLLKTLLCSTFGD
jgi:hypothetical protein